MPTKVEKDAITGTETTGHEWDGIKELNSPLPKWWLYVFYATIVWSVVWWVLYPSIPGLHGYVHGLLGYSQRAALDDQLATARQGQAVWRDRIEAASLPEIRNNPDLLNFALAGGAAAFADNCAPCHGLGGAGRRGFPILADDDWLWGGTLDDIRTTLLHGVRSDDTQARTSQMPSFGAMGLLTRQQIADVADHVLSLSGAGPANAAGADVYAANCASCHGPAGEGGRDFGAPRLNDRIWLYGGTRADLIAQVTQPRQGVMPAWGSRLDPSTIKMLAVYVHSLGGGQ